MHTHFTHFFERQYNSEHEAPSTAENLAQLHTAYVYIVLLVLHKYYTVLMVLLYIYIIV